MIKKVMLIGVVLVLFLTLLSPVMAQGQSQGQAGQIAVSNSTTQMNFPLSLNFSAQIKSNVNITDIRLRYRIEQLSYAQVTSEVYVNFTPSNNVSAKYTLDMTKIGGVPPGTLADFWWTVKDAAGANLDSSPSKFQVTDNRYSWQHITQGNVTLYWYQGNTSFAQSLMTTAQQSLVLLAKNTGVSPSSMVNIYIYASAQDLQGAMVFPQEWTGGVAFTSYNIISIGIPTSQLTWGQGAMTHELTHIVINQVVYNPYNDIPVWLNEGLAMYSEGTLSPQFTGPLSNAISNHSLITMRSLSSPFSADSNKANLSYAESYSFIDFLTSQFGSAKMTQLLNTFHQGSDFDPALQTVYGLNMDSLFNQWKTWVTAQYGK